MIINPNGFLVAVEGLDGCGKTTVTQDLYKYASGELKRNAHLTKSPGAGSPLNEFARDFLKSDEGGRCSDTVKALLASAGRRDAFERDWHPKLKEGYVVISDRFHLSTLAFAPKAERRTQLVDIANCNINPNLILFLDVDYKTAIARITARGGAEDHFERFDTLTFNTRRSIMTEYCREHRNCVIINATQPLDKVLEQCRHIFTEKLFTK